MTQPHSLPTPAVALLLVASLLLLGGCESIYEDTKGWANRLHASIVEAGDDGAGESDAEAAEAATTQAQAMSPKPRPEGTPILIEPNPAEDLRQDDLLLDELPDPVDPKPTKEAKDGDGAVDDAAAALAAAPEKEAAAEPGSKQELAALPPLPQRKPDTAGQMRTAAGAGSDVAMVLHLSSLRSESAAKREWSDLQRAYPEPLGDMTAEIRRTELDDKGVFYRVLAGPLPSRNAAKEVCDAVKTQNAKQYCRVMPSKPKG